MRRLDRIVPALALPLVALVAPIGGCNGIAQPAGPSQPLTWGDAEWPDAPIPQPGGNGSGGDDDSDSDGDPGGSSGGSFVPGDDLGSVSACDPFAQDCPDGEKCVAYASTGGDYDATKCVPVLGAGGSGDMCTYAGPVEATDDCDGSHTCWDVTQMSGTCTQFCTGTADSPVCPEGLECLIAYEGSVNVCVDGAPSETGTETGTETGMPDLEDPERLPNADPHADEPPLDPLPLQCPDEPEPVVLYMSNDDSNSQASPVIVRRQIRDGLAVDDSAVRIHEFLNYYTITDDYPTDKPAEVAIEMRRTNAETGEFTLLLSAKGQQLRAEDRPPLNLVFSLDTSGSMGGERIDLVKASMHALAGGLRAGDVISMVSWSSTQAVLLQTHTVSGPDDPALLLAIDSLEATGSTDLHGGLVSAYELAELGYLEGGINRVVLISDGGANAGVTELDIIAEAAAAEDGTGIYLVGVGVGPAAGYRDDLMDAVTDAGKGAYIFIDSPAEAELQFDARFLANVAVAARNVRMRATLPWYFGVKSFHGEEYSADPAEVEPQHLAPNDAMSFHQILAACDPNSIDASDTIEAHVEYLHPLTLAPMSDTLSAKIGSLVTAPAEHLYKADAVVGFAKAIIVIDAQLDAGQPAEALATAQAMQGWLAAAAAALGDPELDDLAALMGEYQVLLQEL